MLKKGIHKTFITCQLHKNISSAGTLVVSFIGLQTQEVKIQPVMKIMMQSNAHELDEVMVVAYGGATKRSFTGSATEIDRNRLH